MVSGPVCTLLALPAMMLWDFLLAVTSHWIIAFLVLIAGFVILGAAMILIGIEIFELVPLLSVLIDWLELILVSPVGPAIFVYMLLSFAIASGVVPCG